MPLENNILENNTLDNEHVSIQLNDSNNETEETKINNANEVLSITDFENVKAPTYIKTNSETSNQNNKEVLNTLPQRNNTNEILEGGNKEVIINEDEKDEKESNLLEENTKENQVANRVENREEDKIVVQSGGAITDGIVYEIDFLVIDDKELINITKVNSIVDKYINNFYSEEMKKYKQSFKNLYQKYSNKHYIINNIGNIITVMKNEKKKDMQKHIKDKDIKDKDIVLELKKPQYLYYNNDGNLEILKRQISNDRAELQYLYQALVNKLNVSPDEKKDFEKQRKKFIESLETYYIYTLYHKKINKISTTNKNNIIIQELLGDNNLLEGNLYSIDNSLIELINNQNASKLNEFNNLISSMQSIKNIKNDKKILETIKEYLNKNETNKLLEAIKNIANQQDNYINYIITNLS